MILLIPKPDHKALSGSLSPSLCVPLRPYLPWPPFEAGPQFACVLTPRMDKEGQVLGRVGLGHQDEVHLHNVK